MLPILIYVLVGPSASSRGLPTPWVRVWRFECTDGRSYRSAGNAGWRKISAAGTQL